VRAALVAALLTGNFAPLVAAAESDAVAAARTEVERLRGEMELAYLDVQRDHERVRGAAWSDASFGDEFASALTEFVADARARADAEAARGDSEAAAALARSLASRRVDPPLTRTSLPVVLAETARASRVDAAAAPRDLFVASARRVFAAGKPDDVWDARFLATPVVEEFRAAQAKLAAAQEAEAAKPPAPTAPSADKPAEKSAEGAADRPVKLLDEMVFLDKARPWIGPWTGWTTDLPEKLNKRQQRPVKAVWFDRYETTCAQYRAYVEGLPPAARRAALPQGWTLDEKDAVQAPAGKDHHPVAGITWRQAQAYAESQGKRLPTSDEWERAAAGVEKEPRLFPWGAENDTKKWAHLGVEPKGTFRVDEFPDDATPEGLVGMAGNVAELCSTCSDRTEIGKNGPEKTKQVLVCGGSFSSRTSDCVSSFHWVLDADGASPNVGFRCVMDDAEYKKRHK
jgi:formylglycine-generating enzyme required for sulfatase activity